MVKMQQQRIEQLEMAFRAAKSSAGEDAKGSPDGKTAAARVVTEGELPGSFKLPGSDTSIKIYGNVRVDATHDTEGRTNNVNGNGWAVALPIQPLEGMSGARRTGQSYLTARGSRFGIMSQTPTAMGALQTQIEGDFDAPNPFQGELSSNSTGFRLRQAWGQLGGLLVGQTWSNFIDLGSLPQMVEFNSSGAVPLLRQGQIRYTQPLGQSASLAVALENAQSLSFVASPAADFDRSVDVTANFTLRQPWGHVSARVASLEYKNDRDAKRGHALALSGSFKLGERDSLVYLVSGGDGIGRYMFSSLAQGAIDVGGDIRLWKALGGHIGLSHAWNDQWRTNLVLSGTRFESDAVANAAQRAVGNPDFYPNETLRQVFLNTFWTPGKGVEYGLEYAWGRRETFNGETGKLGRVTAMARYSF